MKIAQEDLLPGDLILIAKSGKLLIGKVGHVTKAGSRRYMFDSIQSEIKHYHDFKVEDINFNKTAYIEKPWKPKYQSYFWLLERKK